jgi:hypothetical protein
MRWSYKTVHYDYKKEGLLGGAFLDEAEMEESMNEFGRAGWELVSLLEVQEGLIATFKQPIDAPVLQDSSLGARTNKQDSDVDLSPRFLRPERQQEVQEDPKDEIQEKALHRSPLRPVSSEGLKKRTPGDKEEAGAGSIRIE